MYKSILASITMYSIVFLLVGPVAFALPQGNLTKDTRTETKNCASSSVASANPYDRLANLGRQTQNIELLSVARSQGKGTPVELVSSSSGELAFAQTDLAFKDNPLLLFQRTYLSSRDEDVGLGRGWSFAFNDSIALNDNNAVLTTSIGDTYTYRRDEARHYVLQTSDSTDVKEFNVENGNTISAKNGDVTKVYKSTNGYYHLSQVIAPGGFEITINRTSNGRIRSISGLSFLRPNPRGSVGYGTKFQRANMKDWGGQDYQDLMTGVDKVIEMGVADPDRLGVMGWSYGGYMTSWIVTQTKRFKAASAGAVVTNLMSMNGVTDIPALIPDYFGGQAWDDPEIYAKRSAMFNIKGVSTPTLVQHGESDIRVPISQGYEFYYGLKSQNVPTRMIVLPRQPHGPNEPKMQLAAMQSNLDWFEKYLK